MSIEIKIPSVGESVQEAVLAEWFKQDGDTVRKDVEERKPMTPIRRRIAERLLEAKQNTAMLTTFNEIDMSRAMEIRSLTRSLSRKSTASLGFMSFFVKACVEALKEIPEINAFIDGSDIVYHDYCHIGMAVGAPKGWWCR
jgi:2-oxoglutarate dehydrogenase E2 component (dihydrolipoamide succinyltransferase)